MRRCAKICKFSHMRHNFRVCNFENALLYAEKYAMCRCCNIWDRICDRIFSYNRYPYNCASVQRALLAPEILNESFLSADTLRPYTVAGGIISIRPAYSCAHALTYTKEVFWRLACDLVSWIQRMICLPFQWRSQRGGGGGLGGSNPHWEMWIFYCL